MKNLAAYILAFVLGGASCLAWQVWRASRGLAVIRVVDGDTVRVAAGESVRLAGFDAPEKSRRWAECERSRSCQALQGSTVDDL